MIGKSLVVFFKLLLRNNSDFQLKIHSEYWTDVHNFEKTYFILRVN
jgi:hypothetical protein